jgi:hypothetical protein
VPELAALNRAGFVTDFSQPGEPLEDGFSQRAAVSAYCNESVARRVAALTLSTDLIVIAFPPGADGGHYVPITIDNHRPCTWGGRYGIEELRYLAESCPGLIEESGRLWKIDVIDPQWGRERYLWNHLKAAVIAKTPSSFCTSPADETLGVDLVW